MRQIKFTHSGHSAIFGAFSSGDVLRCGADAAHHFVEEARCAQYDGAEPESQPPASAPAADDTTNPAARKVARKTTKGD